MQRESQTQAGNPSSQEPHENSIADKKIIGDSTPKSASAENKVMSELQIEINQLRSSSADNPVVVSIHNLLEVTLEVYWIDYDGVERRFCSVPASHRMTVDTFETHVWKVYSSELNIEQFYHASSHPKQVCVIKQKIISLGACPPTEEEAMTKEEIAEAVEAAFPEIKTAEAEEEPPIEEEKPVYDPKRCAECDKKLKLVSTHTCRCELNFCVKHRYAEEHNCSFDYKDNARIELIENNPLVKGDNFRGARL